MVQLSGWLMRKCPGPPKIWKRMQTFRINANFTGRSRNCFVLGQRVKMKALQYATLARKQKVYDFKELYTLRIEAASEEHGIPFRYFWSALKEMDVQLNRKVVADIAIYEPRTFASFCELAKQHNVDKGLNIPEHSYPKISVITRAALKMRIAVEGCCHDELEVIYDTIEHIQKIKGITVDLLLICGDFEATRNPDDLLCMAVPPKYRDMKYFYKYYKKEKVAPMLTIIIGGNHEASNYMQELPYGGWLAPNIYYLGYAGIINVGGIRIGGMSGIYKGKDYHKGHFERPPYSNDTLRSCYHVRSLEVFRLKQVTKPVDIMLSHDWPLHAVHAGNIEQLLKWKPDFRAEIEQDSLGSPPAQEVLSHIKPTYWFSAHLHCKYPAVIKHKCEEGEKITKFLALDKCLPKRSFLQILDIASGKEPPYKIELDGEWLAILKNTNHLLSLTNTNTYMPGVGYKGRYDFKVEDEEIAKLSEDFGGDLTLPENFEMTVTPYDGASNKKNGKAPQCMVNPQTTLLCQMLGITDPFAVFCGKSTEENPDEISLDVDSESETTTQDGDTADDTAGDTADEEVANSDNTLDVSSGDRFPTFLNTESSAEDSLCNESSVSESNDGKPGSSSAAKETDMVTSNDNVTNDFKLSKPLNLPEPKAVNTECNSEVLESAAVKKRLSSDESEITANVQTESNDDTNSSVKRFKRRNVAMYSILTNQSADGDNSDSSLL